MEKIAEEFCLKLNELYERKYDELVIEARLCGLELNSRDKIDAAVNVVMKKHEKKMGIESYQILDSTEFKEALAKCSSKRSADILRINHKLVSMACIKYAIKANDAKGEVAIRLIIALGRDTEFGNEKIASLVKKSFIFSDEKRCSDLEYNAINHFFGLIIDSLIAEEDLTNEIFIKYANVLLLYRKGRISGELASALYLSEFLLKYLGEISVEEIFLIINSFLNGKSSVKNEFKPLFKPLNYSRDEYVKSIAMLQQIGFSKEIIDLIRERFYVNYVVELMSVDLEAKVPQQKKKAK